MNLAIMQPYFFPYIGYWQLIHAVDRFVIYDDVNYIKGGWINRNRILINNTPSFITAPLYQSSSYKRICDISFNPSINWRNKLLITIENTYRKAPFFSDIFPVISRIICYETDNLATFLSNQLHSLSLFIGIQTEFVLTSRIYDNQSFSAQKRVFDICKREQTDVYVNAKGGYSLYQPQEFSNIGIQLKFIEMNTLFYNQKSEDFVPQLSIIDALMNVGVIGIKKHLDAFELKC
jgi:hypothetical protein